MANFPAEQPLKVVILVCPNFYTADVIGAHTVFGSVPNTEMHLAWKTREVVDGPNTWPTMPSTTFADCPAADVFVVGAVPPDVIGDQEVAEFTARQAQGASAVLGICGGALVLGAAGLLQGRKATASFVFIDGLAQVGAQTIRGGEVVVDGKFYTAGPVTGGFEASLMALAELRGEQIARAIEMGIEYNPRTVFGTGNAEFADFALPEGVAESTAEYATACANAARAMMTRMSGKA